MAGKYQLQALHSQYIYLCLKRILNFQVKTLIQHLKKFLKILYIIMDNHLLYLFHYFHLQVYRLQQ